MLLALLVTMLLACAAIGCSPSGGTNAEQRSGGRDPDADSQIAVPELLIEGPETVRAAAEGIRRVDESRMRAVIRLVGLEEPGPPIHVVLVPEDSATAEQTPGWVAGYARGQESLIVLFPARSPSYPDSSFQELLAHEVAHVLIDRAAAGRELPRWFHEGLAMVAGGSWGLGDTSRLTTAMVLGGPASLEELERTFAAGDADTIGSAYALSGSFVREMLSRDGRTAAARILDRVAAGADFPDAFAAVTGQTLAAAEVDFWSRQERWYRWVPVLTSSIALWFGIVVLSIWAYKRKQERSEAIREKWEEEGIAEEEGSGSGEG